MGKSNLLKLLSNFGTKLWSMVSIFIFVPIYIYYLGIENYAIIGFYTLLLGVISFADSGMSSAIIKEFALDHSASYKYSVLKKVEKLYWIICTIICLLIILFSRVIAEKWLHSDTILNEELAYYIFLIGIGVTLQLLSSLYYGSLFGLNEQVKANTLQIIWSIFRSAFVILLFVILKPTLEVYFIWQIICNVIYVYLLRFFTVEKLKSFEKNLKIILNRIPKNILQYVGGMTMIAVISSINSQADKIITSSFFSLKVFGFYNIASVLAQIPVIIVTPIALFVFPLFSKFSSDKKEELEICFDKITFLMSLLMIPAATILIIYAKEIIILWTGNTIDSNYLPTIVLVLRMLSFGSLFLALQFPLFYFLLSQNKTRYTVYQGIVQIVLGLPILYLCASKFGLKAIAIPWIIINVGGFIYLCLICFKKYLRFPFSVFIIYNIIIPFIITLGVCALFYLVYQSYFCNFYIIGIGSALFSVLPIIFINNIKKKYRVFDFKNLYNFPK